MHLNHLIRQLSNSDDLESYSHVRSPSVLYSDSIGFGLPTTPLSLHSNDLDPDEPDLIIDEDVGKMDYPASINTQYINENNQDNHPNPSIANSLQNDGDDDEPGISTVPENLSSFVQSETDKDNTLCVQEAATKCIPKLKKKCLTKRQRAILDKYYLENPYVDNLTLKVIERKINLTRNFIIRWFKDRRHRDRKTNPIQDGKISVSHSSPLTPAAESADTQPNKVKFRPMIRKTKEQIKLLENYYRKSKYIIPEWKKVMEEEIKLPGKIIADWFVDRRMKEKKLKPAQNNDQGNNNSMSQQTDQPGRTSLASSKKKLTRKTKRQTEMLKESYNRDKYIGELEASELGQKINLDKYVVKEWFNKQRYLEKIRKAKDIHKYDSQFVYYRTERIDQEP